MQCPLPRSLVRDGRNTHLLLKLTYEVRMEIARQIDPARSQLLQFRQCCKHGVSPPEDRSNGPRQPHTLALNSSQRSKR